MLGKKSCPQITQMFADGKCRIGILPVQSEEKDFDRSW